MIQSAALIYLGNRKILSGLLYWLVLKGNFSKLV